MSESDPPDGRPSGPLRDRIPIPKTFPSSGTRVFPLVDLYFEIMQQRQVVDPTARVVDVGCGWGRMAIPLLDILEPPGSYRGLDVDRDQITWAQEVFSPVHGGFAFEWMDVQNRMYNSAGQQTVGQTALPIAGRACDLVICCSVLTHMLKDDVLHYLREFERIISDRGSVFISLFLIDDFARDRISKGLSKFNFIPISDHTATIDLRLPERGIAFNEPAWLEMVEASGLVQVGDPVRGAWCGRATSNIGQDIVVLKRMR